MKKATEILLIISGVLSIVAAVGYLVSAIVLFAFASPQFTELVIKGLQEGSIHTTLPGTPEEVAKVVQMFFLGIGIAFLITLAFSISNAVFSLVARKNGTTVNYVLTIVFSVLSGTMIGIVGGIIGLVDNSSNRQ